MLIGADNTLELFWLSKHASMQTPIAQSLLARVNNIESGWLYLPEGR